MHFYKQDLELLNSKNKFQVNPKKLLTIKPDTLLSTELYSTLYTAIQYKSSPKLTKTLLTIISKRFNLDTFSENGEFTICGKVFVLDIAEKCRLTSTFPVLDQFSSYFDSVINNFPKLFKAIEQLSYFDADPERYHKYVEFITGWKGDLFKECMGPSLEIQGIKGKIVMEEQLVLYLDECVTIPAGLFSEFDIQANRFEYDENTISLVNRLVMVKGLYVLEWRGLDCLVLIISQNVERFYCLFANDIQVFQDENLSQLVATCSDLNQVYKLIN
ncbi:hypothetical protein HK103_001401 [Boothiomyces macroporosus]|uniref:Uncharacterized protein n=1 Tax=Boothiomyces macroporosus TaxID=261099 RepID=A0AAD5Y327_9FUNG|nr:hypothetical protein HK103_001401 [Boothiomyces macroporosus]